MTNIQKVLDRLCASEEALQWAELPENEAATSRELWDTCQRGDWLLWLVWQMGLDRALVGIAVCACATYLGEGTAGTDSTYEWGETLAECANIVRAQIKWSMVEAALNKTTACGGCSELKGYEGPEK